MELAEVVGSLIALQRFPVEPLGGESPNVAPVRGCGLLGDRAYDLCDARTGSRIAPASAPLLFFYGARYSDDLVAENLDSWTRVRDPAGAECALRDPRWLAEIGRLLGREMTLVARPTPESASPLRLISRPTLRLAERTYGAPLEPVRVRANFVVELPEGKAFEEDTWIGRHIRIGDTLISVTGTADDGFVADFRPEIGRGDTDMLKALAQLHGGRLGVAARIVTGFRVRVGDPVVLAD
jgi:hypothetical protein